MSNVWRRIEFHSVYSFLLKQWGCKDNCTKEEGDKTLKIGGSGCEPPLSRAFCNQRWEYYPHKSTIKLSSGPQGTRRYWPTSVLCPADGRRSGPGESSWSPWWSPCSRFGTNQTIKCFSQTQSCTVISSLIKAHLPHADREHKYDLSYKSTSVIFETDSTV